jgi:Glycosyltransferase family 28 N-terminal domain
LLTDQGHTKLTHMSGQGRVDIRFDIDNRSISRLLKSTLNEKIEKEVRLPSSPPDLFGKQPNEHCPELNVVLHIVGSRGDIQPFIPVALQLQAFGHRVRFATHPIFQSFVEETGLEFFSIGGDPTELMAYMVRNPGLLPDFDAVMKGDVRRNRKAIREIMEGCWRSCVEAGNGAGNDPNQWKDSKPFVADAIIANPPAFAHIHCAEKLGVPLHIMFT